MLFGLIKRGAEPGGPLGWQPSKGLSPAGRASCACHPTNEDLFAGTPIRAVTS